MPSQFTIDPYYDTLEWRELRSKVLKRDGNICQYCGDTARQADHVIPRKRGGKDSVRNLVACCATCNRTAGNKRFRSFADKKRWVRANRLPEEKKPQTVFVPKKQYEVRKPPKRSALREKLAQRHQPEYYKEEQLLKPKTYPDR